ncbi:MAG: hypothetical protein V4739_18585, partial [Pseudomonadota bacterium]
MNPLLPSSRARSWCWTATVMRTARAGVTGLAVLLMTACDPAPGESASVSAAPSAAVNEPDPGPLSWPAPR